MAGGFQDLKVGKVEPAEATVDVWLKRHTVHVSKGMHHTPVASCTHAMHAVATGANRCDGGAGGAADVGRGGA